MNRRTHAFTLLEMVVAIAACAVILSAIYGVFSRAVKMRDNATERVRETRMQARLANALRNDLINARISGGTLAGTLEGSQSGQSGSFPGYLRVTTTTARDIVENPLNPEELASSDLQRVAYYIVDDPEAVDRKAGLLVRAVETDLLSTVQETPPEEPLLHGVESMEVTFYDGSSWQQSWDYAESRTLPQAVRVRIQTAALEQGVLPAPIEVLVPWTTQPAIAAETSATEGENP